MQSPTCCALRSVNSFQKLSDVLTQQQQQGFQGAVLNIISSCSGTLFHHGPLSWDERPPSPPSVTGKISSNLQKQILGRRVGTTHIRAITCSCRKAQLLQRERPRVLMQIHITAHSRANSTTHNGSTALIPEKPH